jgi:hypothetical protein
MLKDPKAHALIDTRRAVALLAGSRFVTPDTRESMAPGAFRRETELLFESVVCEDCASSRCLTPTTRSSTNGWHGTAACRVSV